jgi:hypothetical protein
MTVELQVRKGRVTPLTAAVEVGGVDGNVSSRTVTMFELDGQVIRFSGDSVPFRMGDEAIVAGRLSASGIFQAYAIRLPRQNVLLDTGDNSLFWRVFGGVFFVVGSTLGLSFISKFAQFDGEPFSFLADFLMLLVALVLTVGLAGFGVLAWLAGSDKAVPTARTLLLASKEAVE